MLSFTALSLNIWDLPIPLPGVNHRWRRQQLLRRLPGLDADIVLIQEAFRPEFKLELTAALSGYHTDHYVAKRRRQWGITFDQSGGLLTLSRWPVIWSRYLPARPFLWMRPDERLGAKGCLVTALDTPAGRFLVANVHLYAGLRTRCGRIRALQIRRLLETLPDEPSLPLLLGGDFNMAPETEGVERGPTGFELLHQAGFREAAECVDGPLATWVYSRNPYARYWPGWRPDRRVTYLFYRGAGLRPPNRSARLCLDDPPVSDHFGFMASLELESTAELASPARGSAGGARRPHPAAVIVA